MRKVPRRAGPRGHTPRGGRAEGFRYQRFVVLKLNDDIQVPYTDDLLKVAEEHGLDALAKILREQFPGATIRRLYTSVEPRRLEALMERAQKTGEWRPRNLLTYYRITCGPSVDPEALAKALSVLPFVEKAYVEAPVTDPVVNDADDTYAPSQGYLDPAPDGIDARYAWTVAGGDGAGIAFIDLEQGWVPDHEDLLAKAPTLIFGDNRDGVGTYEGDHGTAVLGEVVGVDNALGVVGIAPNVLSVQMVSHYDAATATFLHVSDAITAAIDVLAPGDALLLEVQRSVIGFGLVPTETDSADFDTIELAIALGIIVVEAAGNGDNDLDTYTDGGDQVLNRGSADFRDSGAIMVGAAESAVPHNRIATVNWGWGSNYGSRIDCYGWGQNVTTCGYGDLADGGTPQTEYTDTFGGTSSASPIVTGAALCVQGVANALGYRYSPGQMRAILSDPANGTAQGGDVAGNIGVMPNLNQVIDNVIGLRPDVYIRDNALDTGDVPVTGTISTSPDIILRPDPVADPEAEFGEGSGNEDSMTLGFEAEFGQDNHIYVRLKNRGGADAADVSTTVYWSPVASLVTPDMWTEVGTLSGLTVATGDTLVVSPALVWPAAEIPAEGHYCFVGLVNHASDPAPPLADLLNFDNFRNLIRNNNNVTWRNFNVVDEVFDPSPSPEDPVPGYVALPFLIAGAPDRARPMDVEVLRRLPRQADLILETPPYLPNLLGVPRQWVRFDRKRKVALIALPRQRSIQFAKARLGRKGRYPCVLWVRIPKAKTGQRFQVAARQIYKGEEVGRVTWLLRVAKKEPSRKKPPKKRLLRKRA
ncbi:MAG: S8 family peptidase [Armatimonadota bacterium]